MNSYIMLLLLCVGAVHSLNPFASAIKRLSLTENQQIYASALQDPSIQLIICHGVAGTAKSSLAILHAMSELKRKNTQRLILTRPSVLVDNDDFGALPGNAFDKVAPLFQHIVDITQEVECTTATHNILRDKAVDVIPIEYCRGMTFHNCYIICDESQNTTPRQMKALLTRIGVNTKLILCGDCEQSDLATPNGLADILARVETVRDYENETGQTFNEDGVTMESIKVVQMDHNDVKRSALVKMILGFYQK